MTPPGYNKKHRDIAKLMLAGTSVCLLVTAVEANIVSVLLSATATVFISRGTVESGKNLKWLSLSTLSFIASLVSFALLSGQAYIDADKAYEFKIKLLFYGRFIQHVWGAILVVFVLSAFSSEANDLEQVVTEGATTRKKEYQVFRFAGGRLARYERAPP